MEKEIMERNQSELIIYESTDGKTQTHYVDYYNLDVIISVGYRVKSPEGVRFRKWATARIK